MEYELKISQSAECDIDEILTYMVEKLANPQAAADFADELESRYAELCQHPLMYGQPSNEHLQKSGYRRFIVKNYIVFYRVDNTRKEIFIARVFYGRRDYDNHL
jgi:plasmid stabilization system protein ParE